jgi:hypothetical protein
VSPADFDNPLLDRHYETRTGGSRGVPRPVPVNFDLLTHEAAYFHFFLAAFDLMARPLATWRIPPPGHAGLKLALLYAKLGKPVERWFTPRELMARAADWKYAAFTGFTVCGSRLWGTPIPVSHAVPPEQAAEIAGWLAAAKAQGTPAVLDTNAGCGILVCRAAREHGLDIAGSFFRFGGEPFTAAKARIVQETGCQAVCHYHMSEVGAIGMACAAPAALDDVHVVTDKIGVIQRAKRVGRSALEVPALVYTTLLPSCPKIMLNVESDDYGVLQERSCGCLFGELGFSRHLHSIRSYEKLTSSGMSFLGTELLSVVEELLPARFGGSPADYQFVETEENGLTKVSIVISPKVGAVEEQQLINVVLGRLSACPGGQLMTDVWRRNGVLRVDRREPYLTAAFKILPLHVLNDR